MAVADTFGGERIGSGWAGSTMTRGSVETISSALHVPRTLFSSEGKGVTVGNEGKKKLLWNGLRVYRVYATSGET